MPDTIPFQSPRMGSNSGQPMTRRDGVLKVTGAATYAADNHPEGMLHATQLARSLLYSSGSASHLICRLVEAGLVRREPSAEDARVVELSPFECHLPPDASSSELRVVHRFVAERLGCCRGDDGGKDQGQDD